MHVLWSSLSRWMLGREKNIWFLSFALPGLDIVKISYISMLDIFKPTTGYNGQDRKGFLVADQDWHMILQSDDGFSTWHDSARLWCRLSLSTRISHYTSLLYIKKLIQEICPLKCDEAEFVYSRRYGNRLWSYMVMKFIEGRGFSMSLMYNPKRITYAVYGDHSFSMRRSRGLRERERNVHQDFVLLRLQIRRVLTRHQSSCLSCGSGRRRAVNSVLVSFLRALGCVIVLQARYVVTCTRRRCFLALIYAVFREWNRPFTIVFEIDHFSGSLNALLELHYGVIITNRYCSSDHHPRFFMRILSWICRGMGSKFTISYLGEIWYEFILELLFMVEKKQYFNLYKVFNSTVILIN